MSLFAHKTSLVLIGLYLIVNLKWKKLYIYLALTFALLGWLFINFFYPSGKQYLLFILSHQFTNPTLFLNWIQWLIHENNWLAIGPLLTLLSLLSSYFFRDSQSKRIALLTGLLGILAWNPYFIQNIDSPSYRLAIIQWAITPPILIGLWLKSYSRFDFLLGVLLSFFVIFAFKTGPSIHGFFKGYSKMDTNVSQLTSFIKPGEHLTCHHGLEFYVDYHTPIRCRSFISNQLDQKKCQSL